MPNKLFSKKKIQTNKSKQKISKGKTSPKQLLLAVWSALTKKNSQSPYQQQKKSDFKAKNIDISIIYADAYYITCCLKKA